MKIRNGFVSNSSSSSFIIAVAEVVDKEKILAWGKEHALEVDQYIKKGSDIVSWDLWTFQYDISMSVIDPEKEYYIFNETHGDECDFWNEEYGEYEYDIDFDFFPPPYQTLYSVALNDNFGLKPIDSHYGAGRDG